MSVRSPLWFDLGLGYFCFDSMDLIPHRCLLPLATGMPSPVFGGTPASQGQSGKPFSSNIFLLICATVPTLVACIGPMKTRNLPDWQRDPWEVAQDTQLEAPQGHGHGAMSGPAAKDENVSAAPVPSSSLDHLSLSEASLDTNLQSRLKIKFSCIIKMSIWHNILKSETSGGPGALHPCLACLPKGEAGCGGAAGDGCRAVPGGPGLVASAQSLPGSRPKLRPAS